MPIRVWEKRRELYAQWDTVEEARANAQQWREWAEAAAGALQKKRQPR